MEMKLILLGGNSKSNQKWIEKIENELKDSFDSTEIQYYAHWKNNSPMIDFDIELERLAKDKKQQYSIFAKSAGILLALKGIKNKIISPEYCIFVGMPINWARENNIDFDSLFENYSIRTVFIQKSEDPVFSSNELQIFLKQKKVKNYVFVKVKGNNHDYDDVDIKKIFKEHKLCTQS